MTELAKTCSYEPRLMQKMDEKAQCTCEYMSILREPSLAPAFQAAMRPNSFQTNL